MLASIIIAGGFQRHGNLKTEGLGANFGVAAPRNIGQLFDRANNGTVLGRFGELHSEAFGHQAIHLIRHIAQRRRRNDDMHTIRFGLAG